jgi:hypothetical protein
MRKLRQVEKRTTGKKDRSYYTPPKLNLAPIPPRAKVTATHSNRSVAYPAYNQSLIYPADDFEQYRLYLEYKHQFPQKFSESISVRLMRLVLADSGNAIVQAQALLAKTRTHALSCGMIETIL